MQRFPFQMIMMAKTHASDQRESEFLPHTLFLPMQRRRQRPRKRLLKSEFALPQTLSHLFNSSNVGKFFLELNSKGLYQSSGKEKENCCLCSRPRQNVKLGTLTL